MGAGVAALLSDLQGTWGARRAEVCAIYCMAEENRLGSVQNWYWSRIVFERWCVESFVFSQNPRGTFGCEFVQAWRRW